MPPPGSTDSAGNKNARRYYTVLPAATIVRRMKKIHKFILLNGPKRCAAGRFVLREERTTSRRKFKNFT
jgi:hypothetical protein